MESSELGPLWRRSLKSSKSIPLRSIDGSNPTIAPGASQSYCARNRADSGKSRLSSKVDTIIEDAIKKIYLTAEQPHISAVIEEVNLQCFKAGLKKPAAYTVRRRIATLSDRLKLEKRLREAGHARADEVLIFQAIEEMRRLEQESEHKTKKARRAREMRHQPKPACKSFSRFSRGDGVQIRSRSTYTAYITTVRRERLRREPTG